MRKNADGKWFKKQFQEFRDTSLYAEAIGRCGDLSLSSGSSSLCWKRKWIILRMCAWLPRCYSAGEELGSMKILTISSGGMPQGRTPIDGG